MEAKDLMIGDWVMVYPWDETPWKPKRIADICFHSWEGADYCDSVGVEGWDELSLNQNIAWNSENVVPKYNLNGITDFIVSSAYGHIEGVAHTYTPEQWSAHLGFNANRDFRLAYEKDLIDFDFE